MISLKGKIKHPWTRKDQNLVIDHYTTWPIERLCETLNRTKMQIRSMAHRFHLIKLPKLKDYKVEIQTLIGNKCTIAYIARKLDIPRTTIGRWVKMLGLKSPCKPGQVPPNVIKEKMRRIKRKRLNRKKKEIEESKVYHPGHSREMISALNVYKDEETQFLKAIGDWRTSHDGAIPTLLEGYRIAIGMGYKKVGDV